MMPLYLPRWLGRVLGEEGNGTLNQCQRKIEFGEITQKNSANLTEGSIDLLGRGAGWQ
ncbi:hypothetical protein D3C77_358070 [compost metagenome]